MFVPAHDDHAGAARAAGAAAGRPASYSFSGSGRILRHRGIATLVARYTAQFPRGARRAFAMNDPLASTGSRRITRGMMARGADQWTARQRALALLDRQLFGQASIVAYSHIYVLAAG